MVLKIIEELPGYRISKRGDVVSIQSGKILTWGLNRGYVRMGVVVDGVKKALSQHSVVFRYHNPDYRLFSGFNKDEVIDHINNIKTDNRIENLRLIDCRENNVKDKRAFKNLPRGVNRYEKLQVYYAAFYVNMKKIHIGTFSTPELAAEAYDKAVYLYETEGILPEHNKKIHSSHKGIGYDKQKKCWEFTTIKNKVKYRKRFKTEEEAIQHKEEYLLRNESH